MAPTPRGTLLDFVSKQFPGPLQRPGYVNLYWRHPENRFVHSPQTLFWVRMVSECAGDVITNFEDVLGGWIRLQVEDLCLLGSGLCINHMSPTLAHVKLLAPHFFSWPPGDKWWTLLKCWLLCLCLTIAEIPTGVNLTFYTQWYTWPNVNISGHSKCNSSQKRDYHQSEAVYFLMQDVFANFTVHKLNMNHLC